MKFGDFDVKFYDDAFAPRALPKAGVLPAEGMLFPGVVSAMCVVRNERGEDVLYVGSGRVVYRLEERDGESVFVPVQVVPADV